MLWFYWKTSPMGRPYAVLDTLPPRKEDKLLRPAVEVPDGWSLIKCMREYPKDDLGDDEGPAPAGAVQGGQAEEAVAVQGPQGDDVVAAGAVSEGATLIDILIEAAKEAAMAGSFEP